MITIREYKAVSNLEDNSIPVSIFNALTGKVIGHYPTVHKAEQTLTGKDTRRFLQALKKMEKDGKVRTPKTREGVKVIVKRAVDFKFKSY